VLLTFTQSQHSETYNDDWDNWEIADGNDLLTESFGCLEPSDDVVWTSDMELWSGTFPEPSGMREWELMQEKSLIQEVLIASFLLAQQRTLAMPLDLLDPERRRGDRDLSFRICFYFHYSWLFGLDDGDVATYNADFPIR